MNSAYVYLQIYKLFDSCTPIKADCGQLCDKACCKGDDDCGMYLFPGEKEVYKLLSPDWVKIEQSDFTYMADNKEHSVPIALCSGVCDRFQRPLACRIFPLTPYINSDGVLDIIVDPRAKRLCPLSRVFSLDEFERDFVSKTESVFRLLTKNRYVREFIKEHSRYIDDFAKFYK